MMLLAPGQRQEMRGKESTPAVIAVLDAYDALEAEVDRLRDLLCEIGLVAANDAPERAVERIDELADQRFPPAT